MSRINLTLYYVKNMGVIKVGCLISYDYEFLKISLPRYYEYVDEIYFAIDIERKTWSGETLVIHEDFWRWIREFDAENKIIIYEDKFYIPELTPMECDTRERTLLAQRMGKAEWYIQIDSDEYFLNFKAFVNKLHTFKSDKPTSIYCRVLTLFKEVKEGFLVVDNSIETLSFATNNPTYNLARNNENNLHIHWEDIVLHQSWARSPQEVWFKLSNWSHTNDFNVVSFYKLWDAIDEFNFHCLSNFHPLHSISWPKLMLFKGSVEEILESITEKQLYGSVDVPNRKKPLLSRLWKEFKS